MNTGHLKKLMPCVICSAAILDLEKHLEWHEGLSRTAQQADYADAMTRPIGGPPR